MSPETKTSAKAKLATLKVVVSAYPERWLGETMRDSMS